jgi:hypothetical protein
MTVTAYFTQRKRAMVNHSAIIIILTCCAATKIASSVWKTELSGPSALDLIDLGATILLTSFAFRSQAAAKVLLFFGALWVPALILVAVKARFWLLQPHFVLAAASGLLELLAGAVLCIYPTGGNCKSSGQ